MHLLDFLSIVSFACTFQLNPIFYAPVCSKSASKTTLCRTKCCNCEKESDPVMNFSNFCFHLEVVMFDYCPVALFFWCLLCTLWGRKWVSYEFLCCLFPHLFPPAGSAWNCSCVATNTASNLKLHQILPAPHKNHFRQWDVNKPEHWTNCLCSARWWPDGYLLLEALKTQTHFRHFQRLCKI